jgi:DNA polymerase (family 10)
MSSSTTRKRNGRATPPSNAEVAAALQEIGDLIEVGHPEEANVKWKARAYHAAADEVAGLDKSVYEILDGEHKHVFHVGKSMTDKIHELKETGTIQRLQELQKHVPGVIQDLLSLPGASVGPVRALKLKALKPSTLEDILEMCEDGRVAALPGLSTTLAAKIATAIKSAKQISDTARAGKRTHATVLAVAKHIIADIEKAVSDCSQIEKPIAVVGSLRRKVPEVRDIDLLLAVSEENQAAVAGELAKLDESSSLCKGWRLLAHGTKKLTFILSNGIQVDLRLVPPAAWGTALIYTTGNRQFNLDIRRFALKDGYHLSEYGVWKGDSDDALIQFDAEKDVFEFLGYDFIEPELRTGATPLLAASRADRENAGKKQKSAAAADGSKVPPPVPKHHGPKDVYEHVTKKVKI